MADKEPKIEKKTLEEKSSALVVAKKPASKWVLWVVIGGVALYILLMAIAFWGFHQLKQNSGFAYDRTETRQRGDRTGFGFNRAERSFTVQQSESDGLTTTTTNKTYTQTQGVITAVNSDNIVVAGGGKTQTIKTNGDTKYSDDEKPAVNDTVVVTGTKDGDTITATQVVVFNY